MAAKPTRRSCFAIAIATAIGFLAFASPSLADTGSVYVDGNSNVGAGHDFFGGTTPIGFNNVGLGYSVMSHLTTGNDNVATGDFALYENTIGNRNLALGSSALAANTTGVRNG